MTEFYVYPGCAIPTKLPFVESAARFLLDSLGIAHEDFPDFTCCVEPVGLRSLGLETWLVSGARLHTIAERGGRAVLTLCDGCTLSLRESGELLDSSGKEHADPVLRELGMEYTGQAKVVGFLELVHSRLERIMELKRDDCGLRLGIHPGCHGSHLSGNGGGGADAMLTEIVEALGCEAVQAEGRVCCGGSLTSVNDDVSRKVSDEAVSAYPGAEALVTSCPFCFLQFDTVTRKVPVIHVAELVASCIGWEADHMSHHRTRA